LKIRIPQLGQDLVSFLMSSAEAKSSLLHLCSSSLFFIVKQSEQTLVLQTPHFQEVDKYPSQFSTGHFFINCFLGKTFFESLIFN